MAAKRKKKAAKPAKAKPAKQKQEKEPKEIKPGPPVETVLVLATAGMLLVAILMLDYVKGVSYEGGMFFSGSYQGASE